MLTAPMLHEVNLVRATEVASQARASIYDCLYLILADEHGCPFVTADRKIRNAFPHANIIEIQDL